MQAMLPIIAVAGIAMVSGVSAQVPLPPSRPGAAGSPGAAGTGTPHSPETAQPAPTKPPAKPDDAPQAAKEPDNCLERLRSAGFGVEAAETPQTGNDLCRIEAPVRLLSVPVKSRPEASIILKEHPTLGCGFAESFGRWLGDLAAPAIKGYLGSDLKAVQTGPGYECRNRNHEASGKISAHAAGTAIDVSAFELSDGTTLGIKPNGDVRREGAIAALRKAACGWFTTILGPGSDPAHADHLHVDVLKHGSSDRYRICE